MTEIPVHIKISNLNKLVIVNNMTYKREWIAQSVLMFEVQHMVCTLLISYDFDENKILSSTNSPLYYGFEKS